MRREGRGEGDVDLDNSLLPSVKDTGGGGLRGCKDRSGLLRTLLVSPYPPLSALRPSLRSGVVCVF